MFRVFAAISLLLAASARADDPRPPVTLEAEVVTTSATYESGQRFSSTSLRVRLAGAGKEATVITEGLHSTVSRTGKRVTVTLTMPEKKDAKGRLVVPSADRLGLVKLHMGEVADVRTPVGSPDLREALKEAVAGKAEIVVEYEVAEVWAKRFGVVGGKVSGTAAIAK